MPATILMFMKTIVRFRRWRDISIVRTVRDRGNDQDDLKRHDLASSSTANSLLLYLCVRFKTSICAAESSSSLFDSSLWVRLST